MSKTKQNARLLADAEQRLSEMGNVIRVVNIVSAGPRRWGVEFSQKIYHPKRTTAGNFWYADTEDGEWLETDELGAFIWALQLIEKHKERNRG